MITLYEYMATRTERIAASLADFVATTNPDRLDWAPATGPESRTRSVLALVAECVGVNQYVTALLRGEAAPLVPGKTGPLPEVATSAGAYELLTASAAELAAAIRALDEDALARPYPHWRGALSGELMIEIPYRNMAYHAGQVNMIQLLDGDTEFHLPASWL